MAPRAHISEPQTQAVAATPGPSSRAPDHDLRNHQKQMLTSRAEVTVPAKEFRWNGLRKSGSGMADAAVTALIAE
jgi:hypothetical protein